MLFSCFSAVMAKASSNCRCWRSRTTAASCSRALVVGVAGRETRQASGRSSRERRQRRPAPAPPSVPANAPRSSACVSRSTRTTSPLEVLVPSGTPLVRCSGPAPSHSLILTGGNSSCPLHSDGR